MTLYEYLLTFFSEDVISNPNYESYFVLGTLILALIFTALICRALLGIFNIFFK